MKKIETVVKKELFDALGLSIGKCLAYTDEKDSYVRVHGDITCTGEWTKGHNLIVKANLCDEDGQIIRIDEDLEKKKFLEVGYESFSISCYKGYPDSIKYVEIYPRVEY